MAHLNAPHFQNEDAARAYLESIRWASGRVCPHCGSVDNSYVTKRAGKYRCGAKECRKDFTVTVGTVYERSHIPLHQWLLATYLLCSSKKGISAHQLHRMLGVTYKSAWFMAHRIRESMREGKDFGPLGGENKVVEVDETYVGGKAKNRKGHVPPKEAVMSLVERDGKVRSFHVPNVTAKTLKPILEGQMHGKTYVMTDESPVYPSALREGGFSHGTVNHGIEEYVRGGFWHTNTVEGYFSILKRGINGTYHHVSQQHLKRYLAEFDFRYNERAALGVDDAARADKALLGSGGKRLTYQGTNSARA